MIAALMARILESLHEGGDWCSLEKAQSLAALVVGLRPRVVVEIGVWMGGSFVPMAMALRCLREADEAAGRPVVDRRAVAIDPWSAQESCRGQEAANASWWRSADHEQAMAAFLARIDAHGLRSICEVVRASSDEASIPSSIGLLHVDGNHAEQARRDVERFAPSVEPGGMLVLDDLRWSGDHVLGAKEHAAELGFRELHELGTGIVMQRVGKERT